LYDGPDPRGIPGQMPLVGRFTSVKLEIAYIASSLEFSGWLAVILLTSSIKFFKNILHFIELY